MHDLHSRSLAAGLPFSAWVELFKGGYVKRIIGMFLVIAVLAGVAFTAQVWSDRTQPGPLANLPGTGALQMVGFVLSEPASIVLSSLILLGSTTMLRRRRTQQRDLLQVRRPTWQFLAGSGGNIKEVV
jgi:hypothetical protein